MITSPVKWLSQQTDKTLWCP